VSSLGIPELHETVYRGPGRARRQRPNSASYSGAIGGSGEWYASLDSRLFVSRRCHDADEQTSSEESLERTEEPQNDESPEKRRRQRPRSNQEETQSQKKEIGSVPRVHGEAGRLVMCICIAVLLLSTMTGVAVAPASAIAGQGDLAATQAYIQANYRLVQAAASRIHRIEAALHRVLAQVRSECPMAAANSPQDPESTQLSNEVIGAMVTAAVALDRPAGREFVSAAGRLTWSNGTLTRTVHAYVGKVRTLVALAQPRLCGDVESWAASGFRTLPASTISFAPRFMFAWVAPGELPAALAPYETPEDRRIVHRTSHLEEQFTELEAREVETWGQIMNALDLWP
jgi:hypothetical protein